MEKFEDMKTEPNDTKVSYTSIPFKGCPKKHDMAQSFSLGILYCPSVNPHTFI